MIIRYRTTKTQTASSLSNRGGRRTLGLYRLESKERVPLHPLGRPFWGRYTFTSTIRGCSLHSYPQLLSVDRASGLAGGIFADNHKNYSYYSHSFPKIYRQNPFAEQLFA